MRIQVLGHVRAWAGAEELDLGSAGQRAVLGLLALSRGEAWSRKQLVDAIWGERPPPSAVNILQTRVKHLRRLLEPGRPRGGRAAVLRTVGDGYVLDLPPDAVDASRFQDLVATASTAHQRAELARAAMLLEQAVTAWHGQPLADIPELSEHPRVVGLTGTRRSALARYGEVMVAIGSAAEALPVLEEGAAAHPLDEALHCWLIRAYHATGQRATAFAAYRRIRDRLADELGLDPGRELTETYASVLRDPAPAGDDIRPARHRSMKRVPAQLPASVYGFTGRTTELSTLHRWLDTAADSRSPGAPLIISAITGVAGVGKTALAIHWAHLVRERFPDGQLYVNLWGDGRARPIDAGEALAHLLGALGVPAPDIPLSVDERAGRYRTEVAGRRILVVLDEAASVEQVRPLLPGTSSSLVVLTSRNRLAGLMALDGARRLHIDRLRRTDAVALLASLVGARVAAEPAASAALAELCARIPQALRVAAELADSRPDITIAELVGELAVQQRPQLPRADGDLKAMAIPVAALRSA